MIKEVKYIIKNYPIQPGFGPRFKITLCLSSLLPSSDKMVFVWGIYRKVMEVSI